MYRTTRLKITDLNPHLKCVLCGGYYVDATTIIECLHSFCRTCILRYLETSKFCPICDVMIHKTRPATNIRADKTLQDLVYKLVPGLYKNEMKRRREYYIDHPPSEEKRQRLSPESLGYETKGRVIYTEDERISLSLELSTSGMERSPSPHSTDSNQTCDVRYLQCPAAVTVAHMKKFVRMKYDLSPVYKIDIFHSDEALKEDLTLMDIAYIYTWRRRGPLKLYYSVYENGVKRVCFQCTERPLSDGSKPSQQNLEAGPSVVQESKADKGSNEKVESVAKASEEETQKDCNGDKKMDHLSMNRNEKVGKASDNKRPSNEAVADKSQEEPDKNKKISSERDKVKLELSSDKEPCPKAKDRAAPSSNNVSVEGKKGIGFSNRETEENKSNNHNISNNDQASKDKPDSVRNCSNGNTNGVDNISRMNSSKTLNGKSASVTNGNINGGCAKDDKIVLTDQPLNGFIFSKPANVKDKTQAKSTAAQRKNKQPKRSLDDTVAKCKARELALQATNNQHTISNGGAG